MNILIKYHVEDLPPLCPIEGKSDWIDLRAAERVEMKAGDFRIISLGISMKLPEKKKETVATGVPTGEEAAAIAMALDQEMNGEVYAAISMALHQYLNDTVHDNESYIITIKRKK